MNLEIESEVEESNQIEEDQASESNIYGIPSKEEKTKKLAQKKKQSKAAKLNKKKTSLKDSFDKFSKTLTEEDFDGSVKIRNELVDTDG